MSGTQKLLVAIGFTMVLLAVGIFYPAGDPRGRKVMRKAREPNARMLAQAAEGPIFLGSDTSPPYEWAVDTTQFADGPKTFWAVAYDAAGNQTTSESVTVFIDNSSGFCNDNGICETDEDCEICPNDCFQTSASCCGNDFCEINEFCSNCETDCGICPFCGDGTCNSSENKCGCSADCGSAPISERMVPDVSNFSCQNGTDDDCDGAIDCNDSDCVDDSACAPKPVCNNNNLCDGSEDCINCPNDCAALTGAVCGNTRCETRNGENCLNCPQDCNGMQTGKKKDRYCCTGSAVGDGPIPCTDPRCNQNNVCTEVFIVDSCCGDGTCDGNEGGCDCEKDCGGSDRQELVGTTCRDTVDNDCDSLIDCNDPDCLADSNCQRVTCDRDNVCEPGETCQNCSDCPGVLRGKPSRRYCCGNGQLEGAEGDGSICDGNP